ncbi:type IV pilus twitching motility protein PilT [Peptostreptococcus sp. D1]|uniref:type IV pilus twitching motility protein PilT n=1 Tax=Peptostreptococcus sp. D1 TaxID=72304 RepID=UPI0015A73382|nr:PilT/PilU family type 4a pilus ATPase [Peptostreptococcus sp. D1]
MSLIHQNIQANIFVESGDVVNKIADFLLKFELSVSEGEIFIDNYSVNRYGVRESTSSSVYDFSDIHIKENEFIYCRIHGEIEKTEYFVDKEDIKNFFDTIGRKSVFDSIDKVNETDFAFELGKYRYRGNLFLSCGRFCVVLRKIQGRIKSIDELKLPPILKKMCKFKSGLVLITGPTGSGKSTTLAAMVEQINLTLKKHVIMIEDPIEFVFSNKKSIISQREIGEDSSCFSQALISSLRQDPDVIVIGEIRDRESLNIAMRAAETGHLCICTLHTLGAIATIERIMDLYDSREKEIARTQLSLVLKGIVSQQLIKIGDGKKNLRSGLKLGRIGAFEIMLNYKSSSNMIREGRLSQLTNYILTNSSKGMTTMDNYLIKLYEEKKISMESVLSNCIDDKLIKNRYNIHQL